MSKKLSIRDVAALAAFENTTKPAPAVYGNLVPNLFASTLKSLERRGLISVAVWHPKTLYSSWRITLEGRHALIKHRAVASA